MPPTERFKDAVEKGILHRVKEEIDRDPDAWHNDEVERCFPLCKAASCGRLEIVRYFLNLARKEGADFLKDYLDDGRAAETWPLHCAVKGQHLDVVKLLVSFGADASLKVGIGWTILMTAAYLSDWCIVQYFLVHHDLDVNATNGSRMSALMLACTRKDQDAAPVVKGLLEAGANPTFEDLWGRTALDGAQGNPEVLRLLQVRYQVPCHFLPKPKTRPGLFL